MRPYDKIFFVCTSNTLLSPIAEGIYRSEAAVYMPEPYSRGLVVLFEEPISPKVNLLLSKHEMTPGNHSQSMQLQKDGAEEEAYEKCFEEIAERIRLTIHRLEEEEKDDSIG